MGTAKVFQGSLANQIKAMSPAYTYLFVNAGCIVVPLLFSFHPKLKFYDEWGNFLLPCLLVGALFLAWDVLFTSWGVWHFNPKYVIGLFLWGLPIEEYLFFICIPFACVFSYHAFITLFKFERRNRAVSVIYGTLSLTLFITAIANWHALYTFTTFLLLSGTLVYFLSRRYHFLTAFFVCFLFILIPFTISNGILTGSFLGRVVVFYNDSENLGIRLLTIPVEDIFYGKLLLLLNVFGFEMMRKKRQRQSVV
jgi:lycopene cyclase domain-containing protein